MADLQMESECNELWFFGVVQARKAKGRHGALFIISLGSFRTLKWDLQTGIDVSYGRLDLDWSLEELL